MFFKKYIIFLAIFFTLSFYSDILSHAAENDFKEKRSTHFIVYYKEGVDREFIDEIINTSEDYYGEIASNLGYHRYDFWLWDERAKIYIFPYKYSYQKETNQPEWSGGCAFYQEKKIWTYPHASGFFDSILPHELGHIIFREFVGFDRNIPLWFEEGVASYQEKTKRYAATTIVKEYISKNKLMTMEQLSRIKNPDDIATGDIADVFYIEAVSLIHFLITNHGNYRFAMLCKELKDGNSLDNALSKTYYNIKSTEELYKNWLKDLKK